MESRKFEKKKWNLGKKPKWISYRALVITIKILLIVQPYSLTNNDKQ